MNASDLSLTRTFSTRMRASEALQAQLSAYAGLFSRAVRSTVATLERDAKTGVKRTQATLKAGVDHQFDLTSRQAYSVLVEAGARRDSLLELAALELDERQDRLRRQRAKVARGKAKLAEHKRGKTLKLSKAKCSRVKEAVFQAQTKVAKLKAAIQRLNQRLKQGSTSMVFGTKKALRQQAALLLEREQAVGAADFARLAELDHTLALWRKEWDFKRSGQFLVVGSKDESGGCQGCVARIASDDSVTLEVKLPPALGGQRIELNGLRFAYGLGALRLALDQQALRAVSRKEAVSKAALNFVGPVDPRAKKRVPQVSQTAISGGAAITWRFIRQSDESWQVSFSTDVPQAPLVTQRSRGALGVDLNAGFLSVAETDGCGNLLGSRNYQTPDIGKSAHQREALQGDVVRAVIARCVVSNKPLVLEALDFQRKKRDLSVRSPQSRRKLSALGYRALYELFCARARDKGVEVVTVAPAYTSTQGWVRYAAQRGWTVHQAAAGVIARRGQGFSEKAPVSGMLRIPVGAVAVELAVPVETAKSDVSHRWRRIHRALQQAIALHHRGRRRAAQPETGPPGSGASVVPGETPGLNPSP